MRGLVPETKIDSHECTPADRPIILDIRGVGKTYPGSEGPAVSDVSLSVAEGEAIGLLGPNGAGKTTLISMICALLHPDTGSIRVLGSGAVDAGSFARRRSSIGLVPQFLALYPTLTVTENLEFFGNLAGMSRRYLDERIGFCIDLLGLEQAAGRRISKCSGGIQRRTNLAVGILADPPLLVLDEPTVGIDTHSRTVILDRLQSLAAGGTTLVYTTHYMEEVLSVCSRIVIMDEGRALADGTADELIAGTKGKCRNLEDVFLYLTGRRLRD